MGFDGFPAVVYIFCYHAKKLSNNEGMSALKNQYLSNDAKDHDEKQVYLKNASKIDAHWDTKKTHSLEIANIFSIFGDASQIKKSARVYECCLWLLFGLHKLKLTDEVRHKLKDARFCKARLCPICQFRRSLVWKSRMHEAYPILRLKYPHIRFIHLTLTVKNCPVSNLKENLKILSSSFKRLSDRMTKNGTIVGFMRSVEITREMAFCSICKGDYHKKSKCKNRENHTYTDNCHPHMHVLLAVPSTYFNAENYLTKEKWAEEWKKSLKVDYNPVAWVSVVKPKVKKIGQESEKKDGIVIDEKELALSSAVKEVAKYSVKVDEEFLDSVLKDDEGKNWFLEFDRQLAGTRAIGLGGCFKEVLKASDPEDEEMIRPEDEKEYLEATNIFYKYSYIKSKEAYRLKNILEMDSDGIIQGFREKD